MNILLITSWYPDEKNPFNGIFVKEQAQLLSKYHKVTVVIINVNYASKISILKTHTLKQTTDNLNEIYITIDKSFPFYNQLNVFFSSIYVIRRLLKYQKFNLIHAHVAYPSGFIAYYLSRIFKCPYIITEHSSLLEKLFRSNFHKRATLFALAHARLIISVSQLAGDKIKKYVNNQIIMIPNLLTETKIIAQVQKTGGILHLGFLGALPNDRKGLDILLLAFSKIRTEKNIILEIGGDGVLLEHYKQLAKDLKIESKCNFHGAIKPVEVPKFMQNLDFFILSSRHESFGVVLIEAMAAGKPVIATRCGGPEEIVTEINGYLVENENIDSLQMAIEKMIESFDQFNSEEIISYVQNKYGEDAFMKKISEVYSQIAVN